MKMRTVEITVGLFMVAGLLSLLMLALQVSGLGEFFHEEVGYKITAEFSNIGGLKPRAKVAIAGVTVGRVKKIQLEPKTFNAEVILLINPKRLKNYLPADTRASIMTAGLLGDNYIALVPGFSETEYLQDNSFIPIDNTDSAVVLEQLISKFVANQVSPGMHDKDQSMNGEHTKSLESAKNTVQIKEMQEKAQETNSNILGKEESITSNSGSQPAFNGSESIVTQGSEASTTTPNQGG